MTTYTAEELIKAIQDYAGAVSGNEGVTFIADIEDARSREIVQAIYDESLKK